MGAPDTGLLPLPVPATGLLPCVSYLVPDEVRALNETLPTLTAFEGPVVPKSPVTGIQSWVAAQGVCPLVLGQCGPLLQDKSLAALVGLFPGVLALVLGQGGAVPEALATVVALVGPLLRMSPQVQEQARGP